MRAEDLMIGDWVRIIDDDTDAYFDARIEGIDVLANIYATMPCDETAYPYSVDCAQPIPLTPEILEKNGFGEQRFERMSVWSILGFSIELDFSTWKYYWANGDVEISSVHELQHAIRLCGITKEIQI